MSSTPGRDLTEREQAVLRFLIDHGAAVENSTAVTESARRRWREALATVTAGPRCACGYCPSIDLIDARATPMAQGHGSLVLSVDHPKASLMLFIDSDRLSYLELAPFVDDVISEFPPIAELSF